MDSRQQIFDLMGQLARERYQCAEREFGRIGLNHTEARLLRLLEQRSGSATQEELAGSLSVDRSNAGRALASLEAAGHIGRDTDAADRRRRLVRLLPSGRRLLREVAKLREGMLNDFSAALSDQEAATLARLLEKVSNAQH